MLARIRAAVVNAPEPSEVSHHFRERDVRDRVTIVKDFIDRLIEYKAVVTHTNDLACFRQLQMPARNIPSADVTNGWLPMEVTIRRDKPSLALTTLDDSFGVLTGCALAQTGTITLDGGAF